MRESQARDAVREMLNQHAVERRRFDSLDTAIRPWADEEAARRMGLERGDHFDRYLRLAKMAQTPLLGLVLDVYGQSLKVDGYFSSTAESARSWKWWQANRMDARQVGLHRAALQYGVSYASVLPAVTGQNLQTPQQTPRLWRRGEPVEVGPHAEAARIGIHSPRRMVTLYGEEMAWPGQKSYTSDFPILALGISGNHLRLFDEKYVYYFGVEEVPHDPLSWKARTYTHEANLPFIEAREHGMGVTPIVRYQDRMLAEGEETYGIIEHLVSTADRIEETRFEQGVAQYWTAFVQRYIIGWIPDDESELMRQRVSDLWAFEDQDVKVGQFPAADLTPYIDAGRAIIRDFAALAQLPAQSLGADAISNISADGLAALEKSKDDKCSEIQTSFGESHEQMLRLCAHATGDEEEASDFGSEIKWAEMSARSFAQTVDGLGKLKMMLDIPAEELWGDIPGWTSDRVKRTRKAMENRPVQNLPGLFDEGEGG